MRIYIRLVSFLCRFFISRTKVLQMASKFWLGFIGWHREVFWVTRCLGVSSVTTELDTVKWLIYNGQKCIDLQLWRLRRPVEGGCIWCWLSWWKGSHGRREKESKALALDFRCNNIGVFLRVELLEPSHCLKVISSSISAVSLSFSMSFGGGRYPDCVMRRMSFRPKLWMSSRKCWRTCCIFFPLCWEYN